MRRRRRSAGKAIPATLGDRSSPRRGHGTRDDRRDCRSGLHGHRLHRGTVDRRLQRLVRRRLLAVGRARLPLRSRRTSAAAPATPPPSSGGGASGPDLVSAWATPAGSVKVGDRLDLTLTVANKGGLAQGVVATVSPSANVTISGATADRGPGCVAGPPFVCDLDFLGPPGTVRLAATVTGPGPVLITAAARARQTDTNPADNDATLRIEPAAALSPSPPSSGAKAVNEDGAQRHR